MRKFIGAFAIAAALLIPATTNAATIVWPDNTFNQTEEARLGAMLNSYRTQSGLAALPMDWTGLHSLAEWRAKDMVVNNYFSHNIPPTGALADSFLGQYGITGWQGWGENIVENTYGLDADPTSVASTGLWNSPEHKANMLGTWNYVAIGAFRGANGVNMYVEEFIKGPLPGSVTPPPTPRPTPVPTPRRTPAPTPVPVPTRRQTPPPTPRPIHRPTTAPTLTAAPSVATASPSSSASPSPAIVASVPSPSPAASASVPVSVPGTVNKSTTQTPGGNSGKVLLALLLLGMLSSGAAVVVTQKVNR